MTRLNTSGIMHAKDGNFLVLRLLGLFSEFIFWGKNYFPEDVRIKKEIEFLELKHGNMIVVEYAARFKELVKFCPQYNYLTVEGSKCIKFESGMRPQNKQGIRYQEIRRFLMLVNKCRIYNEDSTARSTHYNNINEKKGKNQYRWKSYSVPTNRGT